MNEKDEICERMRPLQPVQYGHSQFDGPLSRTVASDDKLVLEVLPPATIETVFGQALSLGGVLAVLAVHKIPHPSASRTLFLLATTTTCLPKPFAWKHSLNSFSDNFVYKSKSKSLGRVWLQEKASSSRVLQVHSHLPLSCHSIAVQPLNITHQSLDSHSTVISTSYQSTDLTAVLRNKSHRTQSSRCLPNPTRTLPVR